MISHDDPQIVVEVFEQEAFYRAVVMADGVCQEIEVVQYGRRRVSYPAPRW